MFAKPCPTVATSVSAGCFSLNRRILSWKWTPLWRCPLGAPSRPNGTGTDVADHRRSSGTLHPATWNPAHAGFSRGDAGVLAGRTRIERPLLTSSHFPTEDGPAYLYWTSVYRDLGEQANPRAAVFGGTHTGILPTWRTLDSSTASPVGSAPRGSAPDPDAAVARVGRIDSSPLFSSTHGHLTLGSFAALLLFHNWSLYMGFFSFLFGIPTLVCGVAILARLIRPGTAPERPSQIFCWAVWRSSHTIFTLSQACSSREPSSWQRSSFGDTLQRVLAGCWPQRRFRFSLPPGTCLAAPLAQAEWAGPSALPSSDSWGLPFGGASRLRDCLLGHLVHIRQHLRDTVRGRIRAWRKGELPVGARFVVILSCCFTAIYFIAPVSVGLGSFLNDRIHLALWAVLLPSSLRRPDKRVGASIGAAIALLLALASGRFFAPAWRFGHQYVAIMRAAEAIPRGEQSIRAAVRGKPVREFIRGAVHGRRGDRLSLPLHSRRQLLAEFAILLGAHEARTASTRRFHGVDRPVSIACRPRDERESTGTPANPNRQRCGSSRRTGVFLEISRGEHLEHRSQPSSQATTLPEVPGEEHTPTRG